MVPSNETGSGWNHIHSPVQGQILKQVISLLKVSVKSDAMSTSRQNTTWMLDGDGQRHAPATLPTG
jgi:hypothetical protein